MITFEIVFKVIMTIFFLYYLITSIKNIILNKKSWYYNDGVIFIDENNNVVDMDNEVEERNNVLYIPRDATVLEIGGRYGTVSVEINRHLNNPKMHTVVEPDKKIWNCLEQNKKNANSKFGIFKGAISDKPMYFIDDGYGSRTNLNSSNNIHEYQVNTISYKDLKQITKLNYDTLVIDCEGCIEHLIKSFPEILDDVNLILLEYDFPNICDYDYVNKQFMIKGFECIKSGFHSIFSKRF